MADFHPFRGSRKIDDEMERRFQRIENFLAQQAASVPNQGDEFGLTPGMNDPTGGGSAASGGDGGGDVTTLAGDVTGLATANTVEQVQNTPVAAPAAGDDEQFLKYDHDTTSLVFDVVTLAGDVTGDNTAAVVERIRGANVPDPTASEDGKVLQYDSGGDAFEYGPGVAQIVVTDDEVVVNEGEVVWLP